MIDGFFLGVAFTLATAFMLAGLTLLCRAIAAPRMRVLRDGRAQPLPYENE